MACIETPLIWGELPMSIESGGVLGGARFHLPAGTVTFLLSDVEGSTRLWAENPEAMRASVADVYAVLDAAIAGHDGVRPIEQGEGDSVVGAFSRASDALAAALQAQLAFHAHAWPEEIDLRVRLALHTADAQLRDEGNYFGLALSRCARLRNIARGGQTLLSRATRDLVVDALPGDVALADCGLHRLRDLGRPEHVFALVHPELGGAPASLRSLDTFPNNLPDQLTSFVGRRRELEQLQSALAETRLLTLTGAGGAGKTRLALQVAADALERFPDGTWWVELAPVTDPHRTSDVLADALAVRPLPAMTALQASCAHLAAARALVILDNCEHLLAECAEVSEALLLSCPSVSVLATSRTPLGVAGETHWRVPSLSLPEREPERETPEALRQFDAVRLFIERARKARPNFAVTNDNAPAIAQICHELDGLPLAIELAAARARMMSVEQIAAGLGDRFHLLTGGVRTALPRHQTLRASVDWSHALLSEPEQVLLRRLAVFVGGFTLDLAEAACSDDGLEQVAILDLLASLVDKSLVVTDERPDEVRYRLLETVRQYALERLIAAGEAGAVHARHRDALLELAESIAPRLHTVGQGRWLEALDRESANFAAALDHALASDAERALRLCVALTFWWKVRGLFAPAERGFAQALHAGEETSSSLRAHALFGRGYLAAYAGLIETAMRSLHAASTMAEEVGDQSALARALMMIGWMELFVDPAGSLEVDERARDLARASGDDWAFITANVNIAFVHLFRHELDEAERLFDEMLPISERRGYLELRAWHWLGHAWRAWGTADSERVFECTERALAFAHEAGEPTTEALAQGMRAALDCARGDPAAAVSILRPTRARMVAAGAGLAMAYTENFLAPAVAALGDIAEARAALQRLIANGLDHGYLLASSGVALADILRVAGAPDEADDSAREALAIAERIGAPLIIASATEVSARVAATRGDWSRADSLLHDALALRVEHDVRLVLPQTFDALAEVAAGLGHDDEAARLLGIAAAARAQLGLVRWAPDEPAMAELESRLRGAHGTGHEGAFAEAYRAGEELSLADAVAWVRRARGERKRPARGWESLTPTELRVVALVAEGLSNPRIGERMFISRGTVKVHLSHIFAKVNIASRAELAAEAARRSVSSPRPATGERPPQQQGKRPPPSLDARESPELRST